MNDTAFYIALGILALLTGAIVAVLHFPLRRLLGNYNSDDPLVQFWIRYTEIFLVIIPMAFLVFGSALENQYYQSLVQQVLQYTKWSLFGICAAMMAVGVLVGGVIRPLKASLWVEPHQINEMERLLAKVDQIRARETLRRLSEPSES
jgi:hypothetical protein